MEISLDLNLPRDAASVPLTRQMLDSSLDVLGVEETVRDDIQVMLTEACSNVIKHAGNGDGYTVRASITDDRCLIKVLDDGHGFDGTDPGGPARDPGPGAENGRGLLIMRALADDVRFLSLPDDGTVVTLEKHLFYKDSAVGGALAAAPAHRPRGSS